MDYWRKPLDTNKYRILNGTIHIVKDRCKGCNFCIEFCPKKALEVSKEFNIKGYHPPHISDQEHCVACKLCELICPEFAIYIDNEKEKPVSKEEINGN